MILKSGSCEIYKSAVRQLCYFILTYLFPGEHVLLYGI